MSDAADANENPEVNRPDKKSRRRGARGKGSVFWHKARKVYVARGPGGKPQASGRTQAEALRRLAAKGPPSDSVTLSAWAARWLAGHPGKPKTLDACRLSAARFDRHLSGVRVADLTPGRVERFAADLRAELHVNTVRLTLSHLRACLQAAAREGLIDRNPAALARRPKAVPKKIDPFTPDETRAIIAGCVRPGLAPVALMAATGVRIGEALAMDCEDWDGERATVARTFHRVWGSGTPKTARSSRTVTVPAAARPFLDAAKGGRGSGPLFLSSKGRRAIDVTVRTAFYRLLKRLGLRQRNPHQLRHSVATHMLAAGYSLADVAAYLGDSPATIAKTYAHASGRDPGGWLG